MGVVFTAGGFEDNSEEAVDVLAILWATEPNGLAADVIRGGAPSPIDPSPPPNNPPASTDVVAVDWRPMSACSMASSIFCSSVPVRGGAT
jgi:hypothetical protein